MTANEYIDKAVAKLKAQVARKGYHENLGQKEIRTFVDKANKGEFGKLAWHEVGTLELQFSDRVDAI